MCEDLEAEQIKQSLNHRVKCEHRAPTPCSAARTLCRCQLLSLLQNAACE